MISAASNPQQDSFILFLYHTYLYFFEENVRRFLGHPLLHSLNGRFVIVGEGKHHPYCAGLMEQKLRKRHLICFCARFECICGTLEQSQAEDVHKFRGTHCGYEWEVGSLRVCMVHGNVLNLMGEWQCDLVVRRAKFLVNTA